MNIDWINALIGGVLIGISASLMLLFNGRVTGISGIIAGALKTVKGDHAWRFSFIAGLLAGGLYLRISHPQMLASALDTNYIKVSIAGLLVGYGTVLGGGCTSGHGVCGISRLSTRSIVATLVFVGVGVLTVSLLKFIGALS